MNAPTDFPVEQIRQSLQRWRRQIERGLRAADLMTYEDIERDVLEVRKLLFDNGKAFAVVDVQDYSRGRVCHVLVAGGTLAGLRELQATTLPFFKLIGARRLTMAGRSGFLRKLPALGWKQNHVLMELEIS